MYVTGKRPGGRTFSGALVLLIAGLGASLAVNGCRDQSAVESFSLECANPGSIALTEEPGVPADREGRLLAREVPTGKSGARPLSTPLYRPVKTPEIPKESSLFFSYRSEFPVRAHLGYEGEEYGQVSLPATNGAEVEVGVPLRKAPLVSFRMSAGTQSKAGTDELDAEDFRLTRARIAPRIHGAAQRQGLVSFSAGVEGWESLGVGNARLNFSTELLDSLRGRFSQQRVKIVYSYFPPENKGPENKEPENKEPENKEPDEAAPEKEEAENAAKERSSSDASEGAAELESAEKERESAELRKELQEPPRPHSTLTLSGRSSEDGYSETSRSTTARRSFRMYVKEGNNTVYLYSRSLGFTPRSVDISLPDIPETSEGETGSFSVRSVTIEQVPMYVEESPEPLPADMGTVLRYDQRDWRRSDWELFSWSVFPRMLIFDFKNYEVQARFLKRLAFFVEKQGFTGELHPNETIRDLHGWNAHDYRASDLAAFFDKAAKQDFPLNKEERVLAQILVDNGIIRKNGDGYEPGSGGFITVSRESSSRLRHLLLTHEGAHGLFFVSSRYRKRISEIWSPLSEPEKNFWSRFLAWRNYNVEDQYLMENEFQAYLMQQHISYTDTYFKDYILPHYITAFPEHEEEMRRLLEEHPDHFVLNTRKVSDAARKAAGVTAGDLVRLRPAGRRK